MREEIEVMKRKMGMQQKDFDAIREVETERKESEKKNKVIVKNKKQHKRRVKRARKYKENIGAKDGKERRIGTIKGEYRYEVWKRGLIKHLNNWTEEDSFKNWRDDIMEGVNWELGDTKTEDTIKVIFKKKEEMEKIRRKGRNQGRRKDQTKTVAIIWRVEGKGYIMIEEKER